MRTRQLRITRALKREGRMLVDGWLVFEPVSDGLRLWAGTRREAEALRDTLLAWGRRSRGLDSQSVSVVCTPAEEVHE
jgi:hypothetical protein